MAKYKVFLDTNSIMSNSYKLSSSPIVKHFVKSELLEIVLSQVVIDEVVKHNDLDQNKVIDALKKIKRDARACKLRVAAQAYIASRSSARPPSFRAVNAHHSETQHTGDAFYFQRASAAGFLQRLPASYEAAWPLPRLNFHQLVVPSLARRAGGYLTFTNQVLVKQH